MDRLDALGDPALRSTVLLVRAAAKPVTADDVAEALDIARSVARWRLERLAEAGELMAFRHDGFFYAMDTYREYAYLNDLWNSNEAPWHIWSDANGR